MALPVPAYMQDTATRHFRIHPNKRKLSRPPMSATLRFRTSLPLPQKQPQAIPQRSFITFAPDLLPKRRNRQPVPEQQKPAATNKVAAIPTSQARPAKVQPTPKAEAQHTVPPNPNPNSRTENPYPNPLGVSRPSASPGLVQPYCGASPEVARVWTNLGGIPYIARTYSVPACCKGHFSLLAWPFQRAPKRYPDQARETSKNQEIQDPNTPKMSQKLVRKQQTPVPKQ